jgi:threonine/homoserine efflux transporter RhtA
VRLGRSRDNPGSPHVPVGVTPWGPGVAAKIETAAPRRRTPLGAIPPPALVLAGIISVQLGAGLAGRMFHEAGPTGLTGLRLWWAALIMAAIGGRGLVGAIRTVVSERASPDLAVAVGFGVVLAAMNFSIYQSFARIPLGVAVTIEFLGPLAVAVASSRRLLDLLWVVMAAGGVVLLTRGGTSLASGAAKAGPVLGLGTQAAGVAFGLAAAACWALYILLSRATGRRFSGASGLAIAMIVAAVLITGPAVAQAGAALAHPAVIATGLAVGLLSSVIPYRFELEALRRVPAGLFGIWMSFEPVVAALVGLALLSEGLAARQWLAIGLVVVACAGAARNSSAMDSSGRQSSAREPTDLPL